MIAFAGNSILCRIALTHTGIDAARFTSIRLVSGAAVLWAVTIFFRPDRQGAFSWFLAVALFIYSAGFSFAYMSLTAATGVLLLFGAVQMTMIGCSLGMQLRRGRLLLAWVMPLSIHSS